MTLSLRLLPHPHWVVKVGVVDDEVMASRLTVSQDCLWSVTVTDSEVSVVSPHHALPHQVATEGPWSVFEVAGPLDFQLVGVIAQLTRSLEQAGIPVFVVSTFDTDYVLVGAQHQGSAVKAWQDAGIIVHLQPQYG